MECGAPGSKRRPTSKGDPGSTSSPDHWRNTQQQCDDFLQAWSTMGYDAYNMDSGYQLHVDCPNVMEKQRKHMQRDSKGRVVEPPIGSGGKHLWAGEGQEAGKGPP
eukprot:542116-Pyramimonas_sp.AAC.1